MRFGKLNLVTFSQVELNQEFYHRKWGQTIIPYTMKDLDLMVKRHWQIEGRPVDGAYFVQPDRPERRGVFYPLEVDDLCYVVKRQLVSS